MRFNAIAPGPFPTAGAWDRLLPGELKEKLDLAQKIPLKRLGEHQELANLAAYLMSDYSAYINGDVITIDGGEWLLGAGEFNNLEVVTPDMWDMLEAMRKKQYFQLRSSSVAGKKIAAGSRYPISNVLKLNQLKIFL